MLAGSAARVAARLTARVVRADAAARAEHRDHARRPGLAVRPVPWLDWSASRRRLAQGPPQGGEQVFKPDRVGQEELGAPLAATGAGPGGRG